MNVRAFLASLVIVALAIATVGLVTGRAAEPMAAVPAPSRGVTESGWSAPANPQADNIVRPARHLSVQRPFVGDPRATSASTVAEEPPGEDTTVLTKPSEIPVNDTVPSVAPGTGDLLSLPVIGRRTSRFGMRFHPILRVWKLHTGLDFAAPCGTPVGAAAPGVVVRTGWAGGNGVQVVVDHGQLGGHAVRTTYNHLSSIGVRVGDKVAVHQGLGRVGSTGYSTGCHLHFEVIADGQFTNPEPWLDGKPVIVDISSMTTIPPSASASASASPSASPSSPSQPATSPGSAAPSQTPSSRPPSSTPTPPASSAPPKPSPSSAAPTPSASPSETVSASPTPSEAPTSASAAPSADASPDTSPDSSESEG